MTVRSTSEIPDSKIHGIVRSPLNRMGDDRGDLAELWRSSWPLPPVRQWNVLRNGAGVVRGVHVHLRHTDVVCLLTGQMSCGLFDARPGSSTYGRSEMLELDGESPELVTIPPGVMHGFAFVTDAVLLHAMDLEYQPSDDREIAWDDPGLGLTWPFDDPVLSARDRSAGPLAAVLDELGSAVPSGVDR